MSNKRRHDTNDTETIEEDGVVIVSKESKRKRRSTNATTTTTIIQQQQSNPTVTAVLSSSASSSAVVVSNTINSDNNNKSMFWYKTIEVAVAILPGALRRNLLREIEDGLWTLLLKYSNSIKGVPLCFNNVRFKDNDNSSSINGHIINEMPYIHYNIVADTIVFAPTIGCILEGIITDTFHSHISISVLNYFNASIPSQQLESIGGYRYNTSTDEWIDLSVSSSSSSQQQQEQQQQNGKSSILSVGSTIQFICSQVHASLGTMSIIGSIIPKSTS
jgi:DNA-directed RNA polymerase subunit E'/Rpb7